jgi:hypothetical protein
VYRAANTAHKAGLVSYCTLWHDGVDVLSTPSAASSVVGSLSGLTNWFVGQQQGERWCHPDHPNYCNSTWAFTLADNGQWGWVSEVYFKSTIDGPDPVLVDCTPDPALCRVLIP